MPKYPAGAIARVPAAPSRARHTRADTDTTLCGDAELGVPSVREIPWRYL